MIERTTPVGLRVCADRTTTCVQSGKRLRRLASVCVQASLLLVASGASIQAQSWYPLEIKSDAELADPLGGGEGEQHPKAFARSVSNPNFVYAGIDTGGTLASGDGGITWAKNLDTGAYGKGYQSIVVDPNDHLLLYAHSEITSGYGRDMLQTLEPYEGIYRSDDGGDSWVQVLSSPNPTSEKFHNYRIWRSMMTPVYSNTNGTTWYACYDQDGIYRIYDNRSSGNVPTASRKISEANTDIYYWVTHYSQGSSTFLVYGTEDGLFRRQVLSSGGLSGRTNLGVPTVNAPSEPHFMGGISYIYVNPVNPDDIWVMRRWDRAYRTLNGTSNSPTWTEMSITKPDGVSITWDSISSSMNDAIMAITPFTGGAHMITVNDDSTLRVVPSRGFVSTSGSIYHLVWNGSDPTWQRYKPAKLDGVAYGNDFKKRPVLSDYRRAPFGAHAGFVFNPNDADDIAAYGSSTFWKSDTGGVPLSGSRTWRQTGYGFTGYAVQLGIGGVHVLDSDPSQKWFPWNDIGIGVTENDADSFNPLPDIPKKKNGPAPDVFFWASAGNVVVNPENDQKALAHIGWYTGAKMKIGYTEDGGESWEVASTDPNHFLPTGQIGGGVYARLQNNQGDWKTRAYMGPLYATDWTNESWAFLDTYSDHRGGDYERSRENRLYSVVGASDGSGKVSPNNPTMYAMWTSGWSQIIRGERKWNNPSRFEWWSVMDDPNLSFKHTGGHPLVAVSPKNRNILFGAVKAVGTESYVGTEFGQYIIRMDFTGAKDSSSPTYVKSEAFLPAQPDGDVYNIVSDLAAHPNDHRTVFAVSAAAGLPFVFKVRFNWNGTVAVTDLTGDLPKIGGTSISYDPSGGGRLLVSGLAGTWELRL